jgi:small subunit ribosomal protein S6
MRAYELMIIVDADADDAGVKALIARVTELIEAGAGRIAKLDNWGKRRFAYEINKKTEGTYVVLEILTEGSLDEVERYLRIADDSVRHKVIRLPEKEAARRGLTGAGTPA